MLQQTYLYNQDSVRLQIEGLPDYSDGQGSDNIGILSSWKLQIAGFPELEGNKEHLQTFMDVLYSYSKFYLFGFKRQFGEQTKAVKFTPLKEGHQITLTSSKKDIKPLDIVIDDAELIDLISCMDKLKTDPRISIQWINKAEDYHPNKFLLNKSILLVKLIPSFIGSIIFIFLGFILLSLPEPNFNNQEKLEILDKSSKSFNND
tara:strand:- start:1316 stop:1927 length:612 start_codon:yes stop_codon:yes gene_type:complete